MNKENFDKCICVIKTIDSYIRSINEKNIDEYEDLYPFIDYNDISLYKDTDTTTILNYTVGIILKSNLDLKDLQSISIVSYILTVKYITDCCVYKPYTFLINFFTEILEEKIVKENRKKFVEQSMKMERKILKNINYFSKIEK